MSDSLREQLEVVSQRTALDGLGDYAPAAGGAPTGGEFRQLIGEPILIKIGNATALNGSGTGHATAPTTQWKYAFVQVRKTAVAYGGWSTVTGGHASDAGAEIYAFNGMEDPNGSEVLGIGPTMSSMDTDAYRFWPLPIVAGVVVEARLFQFSVSGSWKQEYWFSLPNGLDGECAE